MTQQVFADFIGLGPATLSGIFNDRTRPTLNVVEQIKKKIPDISTDWLMFGSGPMYLSPSSSEVVNQPSSTPLSAAPERGQSGNIAQEQLLDFGQPVLGSPKNSTQASHGFNGVRNTQPNIVREEIKYIDKPQRRVTEIRVYYDDQTWESFVPSKK